MVARKKSQGVDVSGNLSGGNNTEKNVSNDELKNMLLSFMEKMEDKIEKLEKKIDNPEMLEIKGQTVNFEKMPEFSSLEKSGELEVDYEEKEIPQNSKITVISLCPYALNLSTQGSGKGNIFRFDEFGETKKIMYKELYYILEAQKKFLKEGYFYVADKRVIKAHGLEDIYAKILDRDKIDKILSGKNIDASVSMFKSAGEAQKEIIVQMIIDKITSGEDVDLNLVDKLARASGINIQDKVDFVNELKESLQEQAKKYNK